MTRRRPPRARRVRNAALIAAAVAGLVAANGPVVTAVPIPEHPRVNGP